jgi:hypothetical protein
MTDAKRQAPVARDAGQRHERVRGHAVHAGPSVSQVLKPSQLAASVAWASHKRVSGRQVAERATSRAYRMRRPYRVRPVSVPAR